MIPREPPAWRSVETPTESALYGVSAFDSGAVAVGEGGVVLGRPNGERWQTIVENGPATDSRNLRSVDATDDGARVWFAGDSGAVGSYDVASAVKRDFSEPDGADDDWQSIAVVGSANEETVFLGTAEGAVLRLSIVDRSLEVGEFSKPPTLTTGLASLAAVGDTLYVLSRGGRLFKTQDSTEWTTMEFDPDEFADLAVDGDAHYAVRSAGEGYKLSPEDTHSFAFGRSSIRAVDAADGRVIAVGSEGGVYRRVRDGWVSVSTDTEKELCDVSLVAGDSLARDVAVGAAGTVLERDGLPEGDGEWGSSAESGSDSAVASEQTSDTGDTDADDADDADNADDSDDADDGNSAGLA